MLSSFFPDLSVFKSISNSGFANIDMISPMLGCHRMPNLGVKCFRLDFVSKNNTNFSC